jgi:M6 family metalloprotease-like protein
MENLAKSHVLRYHAPLMKRTLFILVILALATLARAGKVPPSPGVRSALQKASASPVPVSPRDASTSSGLYQRDALRRLVGAAPAAVESLTVGVIRVSFQDLEFGTGTDGLPHDSLYFENELRHLREYFIGASLGRFTLETELQQGVVMMSRPEDYYGEDGAWEERISEMLMEVVDSVDSFVDFSRFDAIALIHAGSGQETDFNGDSENQIWSGFIDPEEMAEVLADTLGTPGVPTADSLGGEPFYVDNVIVWPEDASQDGQTFGSLGIYAYQIGLRVGMIPLFDTTPSGFPDSQGIGQIGLMGYGLYNAVGFVPAFPCAFQRYLMGWVGPVIIDDDADVSLKDINLTGGADTVLVRVPISPSEYYLVANRVHDTDFDGSFDFGDVDGDRFPGNRDTLLDAEFDFFLTSTTNPPGLTGSGIYVWHIDESVIISSIDGGGYPNDDAARKGVDLEEADGIQDLDRPGGTHAFGSYYDSFREGNNTRFGPGTNPSTESNGDVPTGIILDDISAPGTWMDLVVRFEPPTEYVRTDLGGLAGDISPIPADIDLDGVTDLVIAADTGLVMISFDAGSADWNLDIDTLLHVQDAIWTGPPVLCNAGGGAEPELFITSTGGRFFAFQGDGSPFPVGDPAALGSLDLDGSATTAPMALELDGDPFAEVIFLSSTEEQTALYLVGYSAVLNDDRWEAAGTGVARIRFADGAAVTHMATGITTIRDRSWSGVGFFYASRSATEELRLNFVPLSDPSHEMDIVQPVVLSIGSYPVVSSALSQPASGDVDGDGNDEGIFTIPGVGIIYFEPDGNKFSVYELPGAAISPPALSDLDGDGVMETALRNDRSLYLLTGFGSPLIRWPKDIPERLQECEDAGDPASPLIGDLDGDGAFDLLYRIGGDLYGYSYAGDIMEGWPLSGEGTGHATPALTEGGPDELHLFVSGSHRVIEGGGYAYLSSVRRYSITGDLPDAGTWPFYRYDQYGSSRLEVSPATVTYEGALDERSFICYPNPVRGNSFIIRVVLFQPAEVKVTVLDLEGEKVYESRSSHSWPGGSGVPFEERIPAGGMAGGVYICLLEVEGEGWRWQGIKKVAITR